ncbi:MAG TPA: S-adenosylmethionine:tRNA ribosyltransferase-isomerase [Acidimicrobiales bacterium]|nr:S-adenosylmethionine:tRNA ribosyltransferase-isomerase [Acidimicrobiales bacterium]
MTAVLEALAPFDAESLSFEFELPEDLVATAPIEADGGRRDEAWLMVARSHDVRLVDTTFAELHRFLDAGDVLIVNTSATVPAAVATADGRLLHVSTELPGGLWVTELRHPCGTGSRPYLDGRAGETVPLPGPAVAHLLAPFPADRTAPARLWTTWMELPLPLPQYLARFGRPIRYGCGDQDWPLEAYQTAFSDEPGSAEMPSAARAFTPELIAALVRKGIAFAPITLHTGVSSAEAGEPPYPERYGVERSTAELVNAARAGGHRVVAVGTTATRAIETVTDERGVAHPGSGWTELVITPARGVRAVDGIITGWHEPGASHLQLLEAVAGREVLERAYRHALAAGYRWHEFGDLNLILP